MALYIDLNPVRAGIVKDPKDYRFTGYSEAVAGSEVAREGIMALMEKTNWEEAQAEYRTLLYAVGAKPRAKGKTIPIEDFDRVVAEKGKLSLIETLLLRIRHFSDCIAVGPREWVAERLAEFEKRNRRKRRSEPKPMPPVTDWGDLFTLRGIRRP